MYQYFLLDAFSMNDVNKADMTEKESKVNFQVKGALDQRNLSNVPNSFTDPLLKLTLGPTRKI